MSRRHIIIISPVLQCRRCISQCLHPLTRYRHRSRARRQLLDNPEVTFGGYRVQHPLEPAIQVKVQTKTDNPGPVQAVDEALGSLEREFEEFERRFRNAVQKAGKEDGRGAGPALTGGGFGSDAMMIGLREKLL